MVPGRPYSKIFPTSIDPCFEFLDTGPLEDGELKLVVADLSIPDNAKGWSPCYHFSMMSRGAYAGRISLRIGNVWGLYYGGHIGYEVEPAYRGRRFAGRACKLILPLARRHGLQEVAINCRPDNIPSKRTIERLGCRLEAIVQVPATHDLFRRGELEECRYVIPTGAVEAGFERISRNVSAVYLPFEIPMPGGGSLPRSVWCYVIHSDPPTLIDTGVAGSEGMIGSSIGGRGLGSVGTVLLTHAHPDHIGSLAAIQAASGCSVYVHETERHWVEDPREQLRERPVPGFNEMVGGPARVTGFAAEGGVIQLGGGLRVEVVHTPGHSPGSVSYLLQPDGILFTGDAMPLPAGLPIFDSLNRSRNSLAKLRRLGSFRLAASSWDCARHYDDWQRVASASAEHLTRIRSVCRNLWEGPSESEPDFATRALQELGYPASALNPLTISSMVSAATRR